MCQKHGMKFKKIPKDSTAEKDPTENHSSIPEDLAAVLAELFDMVQLEELEKYQN